MFWTISVCLLGVLSQTLGEECDRKFYGCKIDYSRRECLEGEAVACESPFPYNSMEECQKDFYGQGNICDHSKPCKNNGVCLPVMKMDKEHKRQRDFKCDCHGTGYFGRVCQHKCQPKLPKDNLLAEACLF